MYGWQLLDGTVGFAGARLAVSGPAPLTPTLKRARQSVPLHPPYYLGVVASLMQESVEGES
jgi:hypothetical protein